LAASIRCPSTRTGQRYRKGGEHGDTGVHLVGGEDRLGLDGRCENGGV
jgi:hypothetical protein